MITFKPSQKSSETTGNDWHLDIYQAFRRHRHVGIDFGFFQTLQGSFYLHVLPSLSLTYMDKQSDSDLNILLLVEIGCDCVHSALDTVGFDILRP